MHMSITMMCLEKLGFKSFYRYDMDCIEIYFKGRFFGLYPTRTLPHEYHLSIIKNADLILAWYEEGMLWC